MAELDSEQATNTVVPQIALRPDRAEFLLPSLDARWMVVHELRGCEAKLWEQPVDT